MAVATMSAPGPASPYRYFLRRLWDASRYSLVVTMLNPSTADEANDDPTIRRCIGFAKRQEFGGLVVINLFGYRATDPDDLVRAGYPEGPGNDSMIERVLRVQREARQPVLVAWGARAPLDRVRRFRGQSGGIRLYSLGETQAGAPRHPLYVRGDAPLKPWPTL